MSLNWARARQLLADGDLRSLFIDALGWDHYTTPLDITIDGSIRTVSALAHKRGIVAYHCPTPDGHRLPDSIQRAKIERQVAKSVYEHLIVFTDAKSETQIWYWVKREPGRPAVARPYTYHRSQRGDALLQKLDAIVFTLEEEEALSQIDVTRRTRVAFDVERVTRRFYKRFQEEHTAFLRFVEGITKQGDREWYASVMLNRLMFVYFIQRKGFLDNDRDYLRNRLDRMRAEHGRDKFYSFYHYFLLRLFHEGLGGRKRTSELEKLLGHIPFLNGGLFDVHEIERPDRYGENIQIQDQAFECIFDFLDGYDWVLDPTHQDIGSRNADPQRTRKEEINPDVLGYIFEKYINQKQMGAYYTKEDITEYISKNTVIPFLFGAARAKCKVAFENPKGPTIWDLLKDDPDRYIYPAVRHGITWDYQSDHPQRGVPLDKPHELPEGIAAGLNPPTLHQTVGEVASVNDIETIRLRKNWNKAVPPSHALPTEIWREVVARRKRYEEIRNKLAAGEVRDINDLITLNLDIRQFAQDAIANCEGPDLLRAFWRAIENVTVLDPTCGSGAFLFAALNILEPLYDVCLERMEAFVEDLERSGEKHRPEKFSDFRKVLAHVAAHPNRRYFILKTITLKNLYGVDIMEEAVEICKLRLFLKLAAQVDPDTAHNNLGIEPLPDIDFNIRAGNTLVGFTSISQVRDAAENEQERDESGLRQSRLLLGDADERIRRIEQTAADLQQDFDAFRARQIMGDGSVPTEDKQELRKRLGALDDELNHYLATEYGVDPSKKDTYPKWLRAHQPLHWFVEFYGIMSSGGFDVIIGNPPYVELNAVNDYELRGFECEESGNLYALVLERCAALVRKEGRQGYIVPVSSVSTDRYATLQELLARREHFFSCYDDRPSRLFDGLEHIRLTIHLLGLPVRAAKRFSTRYSKWMADERQTLFGKLQLTNTAPQLVESTLPKLFSELEHSVINKLARQQRHLRVFYIRTGQHVVFYSRKVGYFLQVLDFEPRVLDGKGQRRPPSEFKALPFESQDYAELALCCLNANLFYWFVTVFSDCRHVNKREVDAFPIDLDALAGSQARKSLLKLVNALMEDLDRNSVDRTMRFQHDTLTVQCIYPKVSKPIIDEIDQVLARHYGFTEEELDFIINYDIKYRMGGDA